MEASETVLAIQRELTRQKEAEAAMKQEKEKTIRKKFEAVAGLPEAVLELQKAIHREAEELTKQKQAEVAAMHASLKYDCSWLKRIFNLAGCDAKEIGILLCYGFYSLACLALLPYFGIRGVAENGWWDVCRFACGFFTYSTKCALERLFCGGWASAPSCGFP